MSPINTSERYTSLDLMRGFGLLGVLLVNLLYFFRISLFTHILHPHTEHGWGNLTADFVVTRLLEFKAFDLFSLTFGIGIAVQFGRGARTVFLLRRLLILLTIGLIHIVLVSNVDILCLYALCGLLLIPFLRLPTAVVALVGVALIYLPDVLPVNLPPDSLWQSHADVANRIYGQGSCAAITAFRWDETRYWILPLLTSVFQKTLGLMCLGTSIWRAAIVQRPPRRALLLFSAAAAVIGLAFDSHLPLAFAYAAVLLAWGGSNWSAPVAAAGRMALTNYLAQSIVFSILFNGYGFGLMGRMATAPAAALGLSVYFAQLAFSVWWLRRHRFGPFEWLWRALTYGTVHPGTAAVHQRTHA